MIRLHRVAALTIAAGLLVLARPSSAGGGGDDDQGACRVRGVWELVSVAENGKDQPLNGFKQMKIVTARHYMWLGQDARRDTLPLRTATDTLRAFRASGGAGTYTVRRNTYTERIDYFFIPAYVGTSLTASCRVQGDRWYHSFTMAAMGGDTSAARTPPPRTEEVWRRVE